MRTAQTGDRVQIHFIQRFQNGTTRTSRGQAPLELIVGTEHRKVPGLGSALVGLAPGGHATVRVPPEQAFGVSNVARIFRLTRARFPEQLNKGKWMRIRDRRGRQRLVRILEANERMVVVDTNHPLAGQSVEMDVELITIHGEG